MKALKENGTALLLLMGLIWLAYPTMIKRIAIRVPSNNMDTILTLGIIDWETHFLFREPGLVRHMGNFYPHAFVTYYAPPTYGIALAFLAIAAITTNVCIQFNLFLLIGLLIGSFGIYKLAMALTDNQRLISIFGAAVYIFFPSHRDLFIWPHLFSTFYIPWALYFFYRYLTRRQGKDLVFMLGFCFLQFFTSVYVGIYLLCLLFPFLLIASLFFFRLPGRDWLRMGVGFLFLAVLLILIYWPFFAIRPYILNPRNFDVKKLLDIRDLFTSNRSLLYGKILGLRQEGALYSWFPGIVALVMGFASGLGREKKGKLLWLAAGVLGIIVILALQFKWLFLASLLFFVLVGAWLTHQYRNRRLQPYIAMLAFSSSAFVLFFFNWSTAGLPAHLVPFALIRDHVPFFQGMLEYKRVGTAMVPLIGILSAVGLHALVSGSPRKKMWVWMVMALMLVETTQGYRRNWGFRFRIEKRASIYRSIPKGSDKIILELPYLGSEFLFGGKMYYNNIYTYSQKFHWNFLVNGRGAFFPRRIEELTDRMKVSEILKAKTIAWLKTRFSIDYVIINWHLFDRDEARLMRANLSFWNRYGDIVQDDPRSTVVRIREKEPLTLLERTYSPYHLKHRAMIIHLQEPFFGKIDVCLNDAPIFAFPLNGERQMTLRFTDRSHIAFDENHVQVKFSSPVRLESVELKK